jgi:hypothetical protein
MKVTSFHLMVVVIAMLSYLLYQYLNGGPGNIVLLKASDGKYYKIQDLPHKKDAAEMMATIHGNIQKVISFYRQEEYATDEPARLMVERFNPDSIMENAVTSSDTSYSENKGEKIVICLRDKTNPPEYPLIEMNTVMFVVLHEMAHLMTAGLDAHKHTREFWSNFRRLLEDASKLGVYSPVNYSKNPVSYCGMQITDSPL